MKFKELSYWAQGGVIGLVISIIGMFLYLIAFLTADLFKGGLEFISWILLALILPSSILSALIFKDITLGTFLSPIFYFIIGAIIGLIVGMVKGKKRKGSRK